MCCMCFHFLTKTSAYVVHVQIPHKTLKKSNRKSLLHLAVEKLRWIQRRFGRSQHWHNPRKRCTWRQSVLTESEIWPEVFHGAATLKGNIYIASISLVQQPIVNIWFSRRLINSKIYRCLYFFWVNWLRWSKTLFVIFQIDINDRITGGGDLLLRIPAFSNLEESF